MPPPPIFICENNRKSNKILHCVDLFSLSDSFEDMAILEGIRRRDDRGGALSALYRSIDTFYLHNHHTKKNQHSA